MKNDLLFEARAQLGAALMQSIESDDQIIMEHVRTAEKLVAQAMKGDTKDAEIARLRLLLREVNRHATRIINPEVPEWAEKHRDSYLRGVAEANATIIHSMIRENCI